MALRTVFLLILLAAGPASGAVAARESVSVAAAANLTYVVEALNRAFRAENQGVALTTTVGASGTLFAQIRNGAPFDVFLSADTEYPRALARSGHAEPGSLEIFAVGQLAFWTMRTDLDPAEIAAVVRDGKVRKVAVAQPRTAPYGRAAMAALESLGVARVAAAKLVIGENIAQTAQFVATGNADAGFVALSFIVSAPLAQRGRWSVVPPERYRDVSLAHACILTSRGAENAAARRYLEFLLSAPGRAILQQHGYGLPRDGAPVPGR